MWLWVNGGDAQCQSNTGHESRNSSRDISSPPRSARTFPWNTKAITEYLPYEHALGTIVDTSFTGYTHEGRAGRAPSEIGVGRAGGRSLVRHLVKVAEERVAEVGRHGAQREPSRLRRVAAQVERVDVVVAAGERADGNRLGT